MPKKRKPPNRDDVLRQLGQMAFGKANDCVVLAMQGDEAEVNELDLSLLAGIKRCKDGSVEVKLVDRLQVLKELAAMAGNENAPETLLQAICGGDEKK